MKVKELYEYLESAIPSSLSCDWDNDGLMCTAEPDRDVKKVLIALDITEKVVDYAVSKGFDVIISHHPLIFKRLGAIEPSIGSARKSIKLIKCNVSAMSFHTRLDALSGGVNDVLCERLGIKDAVPFGPEGEQMGKIGTLDADMSLEDFCEKVKKALDAPFVLASDCGKKVHRVALLGGDGKDFVFSAIAAGADTYLSGRISYNMMAEASEMGINLIEAGHFFTENPVCEKLAELVKKADPTIEIEIFDSNEIKVL